MLDTELDAGAELDGYRIEQRLYSGGMAVIYRVTRDDLPAAAVMKVPRLGQGESTATVVSYEVEQMVLEALQGGPVPRLFDSGDIERSPYLVMEFVDGCVLDRAFSTQPAPLDALCRVGAVLAQAVQALHEREVIHLDLKPSNVLVRPDGGVTLVDLGLAHHANLPDLLAEEFRRPLGSAPYIAPEQVLGVRSEARSDIFALGVILYELATGELPFGSPNSASGMRRRLSHAPVPPRALRAEISEALQEVILRCLAVDAGARYATAAQLAFDLQHLDTVVVSERGRSTHRGGLLQRLRGWVVGMGYEPPSVVAPAARTDNAPLIMVAVAVAYTNERHQQALRNAVARFAQAMPDARVACVTVGRAQPVLGTSDENTSAPREHLRNLVQLRHWAEPIRLAPERLTFHALESTDPAETLVEYARSNRVDHLLIGAPPPDLVGRNVLPPIADKVVREAPCSVTIVRPRPE